VRPRDASSWCAWLNTCAIYEVRGDQRRLRFVLERMSVLSPSDEVKVASTPWSRM